jgi:hypothetical protein
MTRGGSPIKTVVQKKGDLHPPGLYATIIMQMSVSRGSALGSALNMASGAAL